MLWWSRGKRRRRRTTGHRPQRRVDLQMRWIEMQRGDLHGCSVLGARSRGLVALFHRQASSSVVNSQQSAGQRRLWQRASEEWWSRVGQREWIWKRVFRVRCEVRESKPSPFCSSLPLWNMSEPRTGGAEREAQIARTNLPMVPASYVWPSIAEDRAHGRRCRVGVHSHSRS